MPKMYSSKWIDKTLIRKKMPIKRLDEYQGMLISIHWQCQVCFHVWRSAPSNIIHHGKGCGNCAGNLRLTHEEHVRRVMELDFGRTLAVGRYINNRTPTEFLCTRCNKIFIMRPDTFYSGGRCRCDRDSRGERRIAAYLDKRGIQYTRQYRFPDLRDKRELKFDFAIHTDRGIILIEYDGEQHFIANEQWGGEKGLRETQRRDRMKNKYCALRNLPLIRIPYREFKNIEKILDEKLLPLLRAAQAAA